jgi:hypothetical protein
VLSCPIDARSLHVLPSFTPLTTVAAPGRHGVTASRRHGITGMSIRRSAHGRAPLGEVDSGGIQSDPWTSGDEQECPLWGGPLQLEIAHVQSCAAGLLEGLLEGFEGLLDVPPS